MLDATIHIGKDGPYYPTKVSHIPSVGDNISLISHTDLADKLDGNLSLKVTKVEHELVEFNKDKVSVVKEHYHTVNIYCTKI